MRDFFVVMVVLGSVPLALVQPQIGVLIWFWLSLMNPHRLAWGFAQEFRVALVAGGATLIGWIFSRDPKRPPNSFIVYALAAFTLWVSLAALLAIHPEISVPKWEQTIKILVMTFVTMCIVQSRDRIHQLVWVIALSLDFYGIKGGIFTILTGGHYRVYGPDDTFISDNNTLALALIMTLPLLQYLRVTTTARWIRLGLIGAMGLTIISVLGSYSRGALLGLSVMLLFLLMKTKHRFVTLTITAGVFGAALWLLPPEWYEQETIRGDFLRAIRQLQMNPGEPVGLERYVAETHLAGTLAGAVDFAAAAARDRALREAAVLGVDLLSGEDPRA